MGSLEISPSIVKKKRYSVANHPESTPKVKSLKPLRFTQKTITTETSRENLSIDDAKDKES